MTTVAVLSILVFAFAALAASMRKHHRELFGTLPEPGRASLLRGLGCALLIAALLAAVAERGVPMGFVLWFGAASAAVPVVAMGLTYGVRRPRR